MAAVERELVQLDAREVEAAWIADCLADFHQIWDVLTPENRARLVRAVIERVEVDEPANQIRVLLPTWRATSRPPARPRTLRR